MDWVSVDSGNGLSSDRRQAIIQTSDELSSIKPEETIFNEITKKFLTNFATENFVYM